MFHLHSSMDRFEEHAVNAACQRKINLHSSMDRFEEETCPTNYKYQFIYIPVWIDLKTYSLQRKTIVYHLHSSMDRFEADGTFHLKPEINNLHSSMDRFEGKRMNNTDFSNRNLHSSMDRFEDL